MQVLVCRSSRKLVRHWLTSRDGQTLSHTSASEVNESELKSFLGHLSFGSQRHPARMACLLYTSVSLQRSLYFIFSFITSVNSTDSQFVAMYNLFLLSNTINSCFHQRPQSFRFIKNDFKCSILFHLVWQHYTSPWPGTLPLVENNEVLSEKLPKIASSNDLSYSVSLSE